MKSWNSGTWDTWKDFLKLFLMNEHNLFDRSKLLKKKRRNASEFLNEKKNELKTHTKNRWNVDFCQSYIFHFVWCLPNFLFVYSIFFFSKCVFFFVVDDKFSISKKEKISTHSLVSIFTKWKKKIRARIK